MMWVIVTLAIVLVVGAACFSFVMHVREQGHSQYGMRLIKSISFIIVLASCLMFYFWLYLFFVNAPEEGVTSWGKAMDIMFETEGVLDKFIAAIVGLGLALLINIKKSNFGFAVKYTLVQWMTGLVAVIMIVAIFAGGKKLLDNKKG
jgi:hypothetical protein